MQDIRLTVTARARTKDPTGEIALLQFLRTRTITHTVSNTGARTARAHRGKRAGHILFRRFG